MTTEFRKTGLAAVGDMPWGTHFCHFYQTQQDLFDIVVPYLKAGLENNEFCLWITTEPLSQETSNPLRRVIPGADRYLAAGDIEIFSSMQWYLKDGIFDPQRVTNGWHVKLAQALAKGYAGLRVAADEAWLGKKYWKAFAKYEQEIDEPIAKQRMIALCAYPLATSEGAAIFDVTRTHQFAIAERNGQWETLETPALKQAKAELKRLNAELEQRVVERTRALETTNATLRQEIAQRQRAEKALRQHREHLEELVSERTAELAVAKARAEEADRLKSAFLATMSHELRTPLNSILGFTGILLQGLAGPLNAEQTKQLQMVRSSGRHLLHLITEVLDLSKIEAGRMEIRQEAFDMRQVLAKTVRALAPLAERKHLPLLTDVAPEVGQVTSDPCRVEQILLNLVHNAIKFTAQGEIRIGCRVRDGRLLTSVTDTGMGIKPEDLDKLFTTFWQLDCTLARQHEGTGLGLAICKRLADLLGGEMWVESQWEGGSTFTFVLPHND